MRDELIEKISAIQDELAKLDTKREYISFARLDEKELAEELEAVSDQLARRKKFLGINNEPKTEIVVKADQSERHKKFFENLCK